MIFHERICQEFPKCERGGGLGFCAETIGAQCVFAIGPPRMGPIPDPVLPIPGPLNAQWQLCNLNGDYANLVKP